MSTYQPTLSASTSNSPVLKDIGEVVGRVLLAVLFILSALGKLGNYAATTGYMASLGVPGAMLPVVIALELAGGLAIIVGWQTRVFSLLLAGFTLIAGAIFHSNFADQIQLVMFLKNIAIAGAFLMLAANGAGRFSLDARKSK